MYKRILTAVTAAVLAVILLFVLGPMGAEAVFSPRTHIVAQAD